MIVEVTDLVVARSATFTLTVPNIRANSGTLLCVTGPNGGGKTTFIEALCGLAAPQSGHITLAGNLVSSHSRALRLCMGYVPDDEAWFVAGLTAREYFDLLISVYKDAGVTSNLAAQVLKLGQLLSFSAFNQRIEQLSHGNKKKVQLIAAFMHQPQIIIIDELRNGLDPLAIIAAEQLIKSELKRGACVIAATHDLWWAERMADDLLLLVDGKPVVLDTVKHLKRRYGSIEQLFVRTMKAKHAL